MTEDAVQDRDDEVDEGVAEPEVGEFDYAEFESVPSH